MSRATQLLSEIQFKMLADGHFLFIIECSNATLKCASQINTLKKKISCFPRFV